MGIQAGPPEYILILNTAELVVRRALSRPDASPFVAHCAIDEGHRPRFADGFKPCRFPIFRFYSPTEPYFDKTWKLEDIVAVR